MFFLLRRSHYVDRGFQFIYSILELFSFFHPFINFLPELSNIGLLFSKTLVEETDISSVFMNEGTVLIKRVLYELGLLNALLVLHADGI